MDVASSQCCAQRGCSGVPRSCGHERWDLVTGAHNPSGDECGDDCGMTHNPVHRGSGCWLYGHRARGSHDGGGGRCISCVEGASRDPVCACCPMAGAVRWAFCAEGASSNPTCACCRRQRALDRAHARYASRSCTQQTEESAFSNDNFKKKNVSEKGKG